MQGGMLTLDDLDCQGRTVILRLDINSPIDAETGELADDNRIRKSIPTLAELVSRGARVVILAHQGDTEDYHNLISLEPHARRLADLLSRPVDFVDDIAGPAAIARIHELHGGDVLLLNNVRYLCEEVSTFVRFVRLSPQQLAQTRLVRNLAPLADCYVCEAFSAAHRYTPSLVGFAEVLPAAAGRLFVEELDALARIKDSPKHPCVYLLGGARIADAFSMMKQALGEGTADWVLTGGLNGEVMLLAKGYSLGEPTERMIRHMGLAPFVEDARELLRLHGDRILCPLDFGIDVGGRQEIGLESLPSQELLVDIGRRTVARYRQVIQEAATVFVNGPFGVYEKPASAWGTEQLWKAVADSPGYSLIGGGDTVAAAAKFNALKRMSYACTSGGGMVRYLSGQELPLVTALQQAAQRYYHREAE